MKPITEGMREGMPNYPSPLTPHPSPLMYMETSPSIRPVSDARTGRDGWMGADR